MLTTRLVAFVFMLAVFFGPLHELLSLDGLLYLGQQWSWLGAFFIAILASLVFAWLLAWSIGRILVIFKLGKYRLKMLGP